MIQFSLAETRNIRGKKPAVFRRYEIRECKKKRRIFTRASGSTRWLGPFIRHFRCDIKPIANVCVTWRVRRRDSSRRNLSMVRGIISAATAELWNYHPRGVVARMHCRLAQISRDREWKKKKEEKMNNRKFVPTKKKKKKKERRRKRKKYNVESKDF